MLLHNDVRNCVIQYTIPYHCSTTLFITICDTTRFVFYIMKAGARVHIHNTHTHTEILLQQLLFCQCDQYIITITRNKCYLTCLCNRLLLEWLKVTGEFAHTHTHTHTLHSMAIDTVMSPLTMVKHTNLSYFYNSVTLSNDICFPVLSTIYFFSAISVVCECNPYSKQTHFGLHMQNEVPMLIEIHIFRYFSNRLLARARTHSNTHLYLFIHLLIFKTSVDFLLCPSIKCFIQFLIYFTYTGTYFVKGFVLIYRTQKYFL